MHEIDIQRLDLNLLKIFASLLDTRSVTVTAERLNLAQSSVSHALGRLRDAVGDPLFIRTSAGMQPTPFAQTLAEPVEDAFGLLRATLLAGATFDPSRSSREFNLVMTDACEMVFLPRLVRYLANVAPEVRIIVHQMPRSAYRAALEGGTVDLALGQLPHNDSEFHQQHLLDENFVCVMRPDHPAQRDLTLESFLKLDHVAIGTPAVGETLIQRALGARAGERRIRLQVPHYLAVPMLLSETDLVAVLGDTVAAAFVRQGLLAQVPLPFAVEPVITQQFWHQRTHMDSGNIWLRGAISQLFG